MPSYENRTGQNTNTGIQVLSPFAKVKLKRPILATHPVYLTDIDPIYNPYEIVIQDGALNAKSDIFLLDYSRLIRDVDKFPLDEFGNELCIKYETFNPDGSKLTIGMFSTVGVPSNNCTYQLAKIAKFTKFKNYWLCDNFEDNRLPGQLIDSSYEYVYLQILELTGAKVDISLKPF